MLVDTIYVPIKAGLQREGTIFYHNELLLSERKYLGAFFSKIVAIYSRDRKDYNAHFKSLLLYNKTYHYMMRTISPEIPK